MEAVKLGDRLLDKGSALHLDHASETRGHEKEVEFLLMVVEPLPTAEFTLEVVKGFKLATTRSVEMLLVA